MLTNSPRRCLCQQQAWNLETLEEMNVNNRQLDPALSEAMLHTDNL